MKTGMERNIKNRIFEIAVILIVIFLFAQFLQVSAQEEITEISSEEFTYHGTGYELSSNGEILFNSDASKLIINQGKENEIVIEGNSGIKISPLGKISVMESGSEFSINGNAFKNIASGDIVFDKNTGEITNADFFTNENIGSYDINGNKFNVPANQRFVYDSKKEFELPEGTEVLEAKNAQIKSSGILDYKGNKIGGTLNFDETGNIFVKAETGKLEEIEAAIINGVSIKNKGTASSLSVFFDKNIAEASQKSEYVVIDSSKNLFAFKENVRAPSGNIGIEFNKDNYLFGDIMDEKDYFFIGEGGINPGYLEITRSDDNHLPILKTQGEIELNQDEKRFLFDNEALILKKGTHAWPIPEDISMISGTVPMVLESQNRFVVGLIPDNEDKNFYWTSAGKFVEGSISGIAKGQAGAELPDFITKSWAENSEVKQDRAKTISAFANNPEFQNVYKESLIADKNLKKVYQSELKKIEDEILVNSGREQELRKAMDDLALKKITSERFEEIVKKGKDPSMTWKEFEQKVGKQNSDYIKNSAKERTKLYFTIYSAILKEKNLEKDIDQFEVKKELLKSIGGNELEALNQCMNREGDFDSCFDKNYRYIGLKTFLCIKDKRYCPTMTAFQFAKMRIK